MSANFGKIDMKKFSLAFVFVISFVSAALAGANEERRSRT